MNDGSEKVKTNTDRINNSPWTQIVFFIYFITFIREKIINRGAIFGGSRYK